MQQQGCPYLSLKMKRKLSLPPQGNSNLPRRCIVRYPRINNKMNCYHALPILKLRTSTTTPSTTQTAISTGSKEFSRKLLFAAATAYHQTQHARQRKGKLVGRVVVVSFYVSNHAKKQNNNIAKLRFFFVMYSFGTVIASKELRPHRPP